MDAEKIKKAIEKKFPFSFPRTFLPKSVRFKLAEWYCARENGGAGPLNASSRIAKSIHRNAVRGRKAPLVIVVFVLLGGVGGLGGVFILGTATRGGEGV